MYSTKDKLREYELPQKILFLAESSIEIYCTVHHSDLGDCCGCVQALSVDLSNSIFTPLFQTPRTLASTRTQPTSSCA